MNIFSRLCPVSLGGNWQLRPTFMASVKPPYFNHIVPSESRGPRGQAAPDSPGNLYTRHRQSAITTITSRNGRNMDYRRIRGMDSGQRLAFEELVCQLARREPPAADAEFRRIEGAGGDGGIEAYWLLSDGSEIGYQAKYYLKAGDIDWANIDDSVKRALQSHPSLTKYVVVLACDLTDKTGKKSSGKRGWEHWEAHKEKWTSYVPSGQTVEFVPWTASDLTHRLSLSNAEGLRRYWFGDTEFSPTWLSEKVDWAVKSLDERFHPEDHVEVGIERLFKVILHDECIISELKGKIEKVRALAKISNTENELGSSSTVLMENVASQVRKLDALEIKITSDAWLTWPLAECLACIEQVSDNVHACCR